MKIIEHVNKEQPMLTVHHLATSQSDRIVWLCEELGIDYQLVRYDRDPVTRLAPAEYRALHAIGTAPVIEDGDIVLGESGAIIEYIIQRYGNGRLAVTSDHPCFPGISLLASLCERVAHAGGHDGACRGHGSRAVDGSDRQPARPA